MKKYLYVFVVMVLLTSCVSEQVDNKTIENETKQEVKTKIDNNVNVNLKSISTMTSEIENKTIDPTIYLDYKKGIEEKVYKWVKSDDGKYYTFAYIDENGEPVKQQEAKINVGANNVENIDNG